jgi:hypothetical protein
VVGPVGLVSNGWVVGGVNNSYCFSNVQREKSDRSFSMIGFGRSDRFGDGSTIIVISNNNGFFLC